MEYDTIRNKSLTWTQKLSDQLNLAQETKANKRQCPLNSGSRSVKAVRVSAIVQCESKKSPLRFSENVSQTDGNF